MTRPLAIVAGALLLFTACGKYGPPVRSAPEPPARPAAAAETPDEDREKTP